ncbi:trehalase [Maribacter algarum]|uniref:Trehalase n=1 Tax=Maribacter algarum (ex Zhang et al. 2020) TaxID=2578118 RepID=A0A5S3PTM5_9FLAO|nr:trehalase family glycosidase [Maribacter algarum]TMM58268.1 trehalase [Maribacter algarum]
MIFRLLISKTLAELLLQEDTDGDKKITKEDQGPKSFEILSTEGRTYKIKGTYFLSNLLQELALAKNKGLEEVEIPLSKIEEEPTQRISRMIREVFWDDLTRTIDEKGISNIVGDDKAESVVNRIYVPYLDYAAQDYFKKIASKYDLEVVVLPADITPEYVKSINTKPGILSLKLEGENGVPFVVPGGRFNEMYGWDSYFEGIGLLLDGRVDLAKGMVDNFCYQIEHYGKILNANRSYYLTRTQPPFLSSFIREVYQTDESIGKKWLEGVLETAIKEYETVWMVPKKRQTENGLNRYFAEGIGIPPETEPGHFVEVLEEYAKKHELTISDLVEKYQSREIRDEDLDTYFVHDRSLRESGHDTSWRLDDVCADLNTVDLNSLLYKYETDFAYLIETYFCDKFRTDGGIYTSQYWLTKAKNRKERMNSILWSEKLQNYFDFNIKSKLLTDFGSATNFYPLWAKCCSQEQANQMVVLLMSNFKVKGGIASTSKRSIEELSKGKVQRQWDYPNGWAPHQMLIWKGLLNYGFEKEAHELAYRWLWMITRNAVDYNGTIPEKYDVVSCTHKVYAEYGNVGTEFDYITTSGFGWMNASYQYGLSLLPKNRIANLDELVDPDAIF